MDPINSVHVGTLHLSDCEFARAIESCELPANLFHHADHIRLARVYVLRHGTNAPDVAANAILRYAEKLGAVRKYHETITRAWMALVAAAVSREIAGGALPGTFLDFAAANPHLFDQDALRAHYSKDLLKSEAARQRWLPPDIAPLP